MDVFDNVDNKLDLSNRVFLQVLDKHAPLQKVRVRKNGCPWIMKDIRDLMDVRDKLLLEFLDAPMCGILTNVIATGSLRSYMSQRECTFPN